VSGPGHLRRAELLHGGENPGQLGFVPEPVRLLQLGRPLLSPAGSGRRVPARSDSENVHLPLAVRAEPLTPRVRTVERQPLPAPDAVFFSLAHFDNLQLKRYLTAASQPKENVMNLIAWCLIAHLIGDFLLQTGHEAMTRPGSLPQPGAS